MTPILKAFLKKGWIQVGDGIPVFFRIRKDERFPFEAIVTPERYGSFDVWNEWVWKKKITAKQINVDQIVATAFTKYYIPFDRFTRAITDLISDYYYWNANGAKSSIRSKITIDQEYQKISKSL